MSSYSRLKKNNEGSSKMMKSVQRKIKQAAQHKSQWGRKNLRNNIAKLDT